MKLRLSIIFKKIVGIKFLNRSELLDLNIQIPDEELLNKFNSFCENIQLKIENLEKNIEKFKTIKNNLFKMIFNQEIQIS